MELPRKNQSYSWDFKLELLKAIDKDSLSLRAASVKFNTPDISIIVKWKKDFAVFGLLVLQSKLGADQKLWMTINVKSENRTNQLQEKKNFF